MMFPILFLFHFGQPGYVVLEGCKNGHDENRIHSNCFIFICIS
ncbi:hypothetical protein F383_23065 [Gossypium arboreum]|uniref:Uncharacterized protein n=1 Tax=Gossypium arboreum TaxID=29729 RepID=A0A0B0MKH3_GOSAR|nr:hypothetical protein F383_23065 [Gossypium arboreum]